MVQALRLRPPPMEMGSSLDPPPRWVGSIWIVTPISPPPPLWAWVCASPSSGLTLYAHTLRPRCGCGAGFLVVYFMFPYGDRLAFLVVSYVFRHDFPQLFSCVTLWSSL